MLVNQQKIGIVILAGGLGKRMGSGSPKVIRFLKGKPLLCYLLTPILELFPSAPVAVVVGVFRSVIQAAVEQEWGRLPQLTWIDQASPKGTGHALQCVLKSPWGVERLSQNESLLVLPGDQPLISKALLEAMTEPGLPTGTALRLLTAVFQDPSGYGRVLREKGEVVRIVEEKDATPDQKNLTEVANSIYLFNIHFLEQHLHRLSCLDNQQQEYYLTDLVQVAHQQGWSREAVFWKHSKEVMGVNHLWDLAQVEAVLQQKILKRHALRGIYFLSPQTVQIDATVQIGEATHIHSGVVLTGNTKIGSRCVLHPGVVVQDSVIGDDVTLDVGSVIRHSQVENQAKVGPYAHLREQSRVKAGSKVGNFVELKKTELGVGTKVSHLSYLGDTIVGEACNIGCGFVTCNYDGYQKHPTKIGDRVFIGSDCQVVAPLQIGSGSYLAAGSTFTENIPQNSFSIARSRQVIKEGYARKYQKGKL